MKNYFSVLKISVAGSLAALLFTGCFAPPPPPQPSTLLVPKPIMDNSGEYLFPYTQDDVLAQWTDKAIAAEGASQVGGAIGAYAGAKALEQIPFVGGFLGQKLGNKIGKEIVINNAGGMEFIKESSDVSFNNAKDYCIYAYAKYSANEHYASAMKAAYALYADDINPQICMQYVYKAPRN